MPRDGKRSAYACIRCVKHKKRCDPPYGACSNCVRAKVECSKVGDVEGGKPNGRRYVEPLEEIIKLLKQELARPEQSVDAIVSPLSTSYPDLQYLNSINQVESNSRHVRSQNLAEEIKRYSFGLETASYITRSTCSRVVSSTDHLAYLKRLNSGAELPFPLTFRSYATKSGQTPFRETFMISSLLPYDVTKKLLHVYVERVLPQCPIFSPTEVHHIFDKVNGQSSEAASATKSDQFVSSMIMAIATMTSNADDFRRVVDVSEAFRREAMHADNNGELLATTSVRCLQGLLLLAQYGLFVPHAVNLWHTVSEAMRVSIELGLHREPPEALKLSDEMIQSRRRLFWATYSMERSVTLTCHRPFAIRDDHIKLKFVPSVRSYSEHLTWGSPSVTSRYLTHLEYCLLQTEISLVNISSQPIQPPGTTYADWVVSCEKRITSLRGSNWSEAILIPDWLDLPAWRCLAWLYMPCPRNPNPSVQTTTKFIRALMHMLEIYWTLAQNKSLKLCWIAVHHAYEIGTQVLYCMQNYPEIVRACYDNITLLDALTHLSDFLTNMAERWQASLQCKSLLNKLKKGVVESFLQGKLPDSFLTDQSEEHRIVDVIFRQNGDFFFAAEKPFDIQSDVHNLFPDSYSSITPPVNPSMDPSLYTSDLNMNLDDFSESLLDWFIGEAVGEGNFPALSILPTNPSTTLKRSTGRTAKLQSLKDACFETLENMPVCKFCKSKRIKCSRSLPSCHNCIDYGEQCLYFESLTGKWVSGRQLHDLQQEVETLSRALDECESTTSQPQSTAEQFQNRSNLNPQYSTAPMYENISTCIFLNYETSSGPSTYYFGETSVFGRLLSSVFLSDIEHLENNRISIEYSKPSHLNLSTLLRSSDELPREIVNMLAQQYCQKVEKFYPILGSTLTLEVIRSTYDGSSSEKMSYEYCQAHFNLILAIAIACTFRERSASLALAAVYFNRALSFSSEIEDLFLTSTIDSLRFTLLMSLYVWLDPSSGNLSRIVNAACRICLDLLENQDLNNEDTAVLHSLFRTTYVFDALSAIGFGRPNYLPEWKNLEKMIVGTASDQYTEKFSILIYTIAGLQSTIHQEILSLGSPEQTDSLFHMSRILSLKARVDEWLGGWKHETSISLTDTHHVSADQYLGHDVANHFGTILHGKAISLLRALSGRLGLSIENALNFSAAESVIEAHSALHRLEANSSPDLSKDIGYPIGWTHYHDLFSAGLDLFDPDVLNMTTPEKRDSLLERCYVLLRSSEACIGNQNWALSECFRVLKHTSINNAVDIGPRTRVI